MTPERLFVVPEVIEVQAVPFEEVRMVPLSPTVTKIPSAYVIPTRLYVVPEIPLSQEVPSEEVRMTPLSPTVTNNPLEVVVLSVLVEPSSLLLQEMTVRLKTNTDKVMSIYLNCFTIGVFGIN